MEINYSKIIPTHLNSFMTKEELERIKVLAEKEKALMQRKQYNASEFTKYFAPKRAEEIAFSTKYDGFSKTERSVIAANIALTDEKFQEILKGANEMLTEFEYLNHYLKLIYHFKNKKNTTISKEEMPALNYVNNFTIALMKRFTNYIGAISPEIIINKINEVLSFNPELLSKKKNTK